MITVKVKQMGEKEFIELSIDESKRKVDCFRVWLSENYPGEIKIPIEHCGMFINKAIALSDDILQNGDEVVIMPTIAGG